MLSVDVRPQLLRWTLAPVEMQSPERLEEIPTVPESCHFVQEEGLVPVFTFNELVVPVGKPILMTNEEGLPFKATSYAQDEINRHCEPCPAFADCQTRPGFLIYERRRNLLKTETFIQPAGITYSEHFEGSKPEGAHAHVHDDTSLKGREFFDQLGERVDKAIKSMNR